MDFVPFLAAAAKLVDVILSSIQDSKASKEELQKKFDAAIAAAQDAATKFFSSLDANDAKADAELDARFPVSPSKASG